MSCQSFVGCCQCEANHFTLISLPIARFNCHCLVCQEYSGRAYSDVTVFLRRHVKDINIKATQFKRYKLPPHIRRGICKNCHKPSLELGLLGQLVFIPTRNIKQSEQLSAPTMHIFYHRRTEEVKDNLPKYEGFVRSQSKVLLLILQGVFKQAVFYKNL